MSGQWEQIQIRSQQLALSHLSSFFFINRSNIQPYVAVFPTFTNGWTPDIIFSYPEEPLAYENENKEEIGYQQKLLPTGGQNFPLYFKVYNIIYLPRNKHTQGNLFPSYCTCSYVTKWDEV